MFGANIFLLVVSVIELLLLFVAYQQGKGKWEGLWVILVECIAYAANAVHPTLTTSPSASRTACGSSGFATPAGS